MNYERIAEAVNELRRTFLACGLHAPISIEVAAGDVQRLKEMFWMPAQLGWTDHALVCGVKILESEGAKGMTEQDVAQAEVNVADAIRVATAALNQYINDAVALGLRVDVDIETIDRPFGEIHHLSVDVFRRM